ncbi:MAG: YqgE/AlgH family protein [Deltaproteobacteria bacterium]|nr:YqgE/AlgH family protein [Deltaproteobacteria bacterium]
MVNGIRNRWLPLLGIAFTFSLFHLGTWSDAGQSYPVKKGALLVAQPKISASIFKESVVLITHHSKKNGTQGLIINKPSGHSPDDILPPDSGAEKLYEKLFIGGPVILAAPTLLIDTEIPPEGAIKIFSHVYLSMSLHKVLNEENSKRHSELRIYAGMSSWAPGQLEREIARGDWLLLRPDSKMVFSENPEVIWEKLIKRYEEGGRGILI